MMLLIGMKMSFTKKPTNPITTKPIAVRTATLENSKIQKRIGKIRIHNSNRSGREEGELGLGFHLCDRVCGSASRASRCPLRILSADRTQNQWRPFSFSFSVSQAWIWELKWDSIFCWKSFTFIYIYISQNVRWL